jgi:SAM-dependent methyltransferase
LSSISQKQRSMELETNNLLSKEQLSAELERIYSLRFSGLEAYRNEVWKVLVSRYFSRWVKPTHGVLDLGCGYGEFINNVAARQKFAMDLNAAARERVTPDVRVLQQDCSETWPLPADTLDIVFTSNFFEHLPTKHALQATLLEAYRCLRPGGRVIAMGPNVKHLTGAYWDFFDHHLPLTDLSVSEVFIMTGFHVDARIPKFLPYTMSQGLRPPLWTLNLYLKAPFVWPLFGKQFLVVGRK